jgi:hypothetical protein
MDLFLFDDLAPSGMNMSKCWNGMGWMTGSHLYWLAWYDGWPEDFSVFRYDPRTGNGPSWHFPDIGLAVFADGERSLRAYAWYLQTEDVRGHRVFMI